MRTVTGKPITLKKVRTGTEYSISGSREKIKAFILLEKPQCLTTSGG